MNRDEPEFLRHDQFARRQAEQLFARGHALHAQGLNRIQELAIDRDGNAELYEMQHPFSETEARIVQKALRIVGVTRRSGAFSKFVACPPEKIVSGDKVILENEQGEQITSLKVTLNHRDNLAQDS